jgi:hypothetical protein
MIHLWIIGVEMYGASVVNTMNAFDSHASHEFSSVTVFCLSFRFPRMQMQPVGSSSPCKLIERRRCPMEMEPCDPVPSCLPDWPEHNEGWWRTGWTSSRWSYCVYSSPPESRREPTTSLFQENSVGGEDIFSDESKARVIEVSCARLVSRAYYENISSRFFLQPDPSPNRRLNKIEHWMKSRKFILFIYYVHYPFFPVLSCPNRGICIWRFYAIKISSWKELYERLGHQYSTFWKWEWWLKSMIDENFCNRDTLLVAANEFCSISHHNVCLVR